MKRVIFLGLISLGLFLSWACNDNNNNPTHPAPGGSPTATRTTTNVPGTTPTATATLSGTNPTFSTAWRAPAAPNGGFLHNGVLYVAEYDGTLPYMTQYDVTTGTPNGGNIIVVSGPSTLVAAGPQGVALASGNFCLLDVSSSGSATVYVQTGAPPIDYGQDPISVIGSSWGSLGLKNPKGLCSDGTWLYVADTGNGWIDEYDPTELVAPGPIYRWNAYYNASTSSAVSFKQPTVVACDPSGNVYVGDAGYNPSQISVFGSGGWPFIKYFSTVQNCVVSGMAIAASGNVYVSDSGNHLVEEYDPTGVLLREWGISQGPNETYPFAPSCIALDVANNHILVGDTANRLIQVFDDPAPY